LVCELAEAGVDAVKGRAFVQLVRQTAARSLDALARGGREGELFDVSVKDAFGVGEGEAVANEFQGVCCS
jgi:hypothetical protein